jgi:UDP-glucuronate 4-epimerase
MRHILVTGSADFIGSDLVGSLLHDGYRVTVVDNFDPSYDCTRAKQADRLDEFIGL